MPSALPNPRDFAPFAVKICEPMLRLCGNLISQFKNKMLKISIKTNHQYNYRHHQTANANTKQAARFAVEVIP
jgi:hypothetical protein